MNQKRFDVFYNNIDKTKFSNFPFNIFFVRLYLFFLGVAIKLFLSASSIARHNGRKWIP